MDAYFKIIIIVFVIFIASIIFFLEARFGLGIVDKITLAPKSNIVYKKACANYIKNFLKVNYNKSVIITDNDLKEANISKNEILPKTRLNLANNNNKITAMFVENMNLNIDNNVTYQLTCWIDADFSGDPSLVTSYDILFIKISNIRNRGDALNIKEENY